MGTESRRVSLSTRLRTFSNGSSTSSTVRMASADLGTTQAAHDDLDDLFNYSAENDDILRPPEENMEAEAPPEPRRPKPIDLGIDEEVKQRARKPNPKLDEDRLLSQNGIPKLRRITKERLKFKGKGHEFSDIARLLNLYQLWLDDLYPKAKFADGLAMIEKLGHSKRISTMRKAWIDESKPYHQPEKSPPRVGDFPGRLSESQQQENPVGATADNTAQASSTSQEGDGLFVGDNEGAADGEGPEGDELDELMAEASALASIPAVPNTSGRPNEEPPSKDAFEDEYADEMEMMRDFKDW